MLYTLLSLVSLAYASSASRLLMQAPQFVPIGTTAAPFVPAATTAPPAAVASTTPATVVQIPATTPATVVQIPATTAGRLPGLPFLTLPSLPGPATRSMECVQGYKEVGNCALQFKTVVSPAENFKIKCSALGACAQSTITLSYPAGGFVKRIEGAWFTEAYSGWGLTLEINNQQGNVVLLDRLECQGATACQDLTIILNNAAVNDVECGYPQDCSNCFIKNGALDPFPTPCFGY